MAFTLDPARQLGREIARAIGEQLANAVALARRKRVPASERIHRARTSCKKARAGLELLRTVDTRLYRRENRALRDAARDLSGFRDADVMLACLDALLKHFARTVGRREFGPIRLMLQQHRRDSQSTGVELEAELKRFAKQVRAADKRIAKMPTDVGLAAVVENFRHTYKKARKTLAKVRRHPTDKSFHDWRKATKAFGYQCRLFRPAWPLAMTDWHDELKALGRRLGDEHDLSVLRQFLRRTERRTKPAVPRPTLQSITALIDSRRQQLRLEALQLGNSLFDERPRLIGKRIKEEWHLAEQT